MTAEEYAKRLLLLSDYSVAIGLVEAKLEHWTKEDYSVVREKSPEYWAKVLEIIKIAGTSGI